MLEEETQKGKKKIIWGEKETYRENSRSGGKGRQEKNLLAKVQDVEVKGEAQEKRKYRVKQKEFEGKEEKKCRERRRRSERRRRRNGGRG